MELARAAAEAEFDAVQLPVSPQAALTPETDQARCLEILRTFRDAGVSIAALRCDFGERCQVSAPAEETRGEARRLLSESLQRGEWLGAEVLTMPVVGLVGGRAGPSATSYSEALARTCHSLTALVPEAELRGLRLALEVPGDGFLTNPVETAELIDLVNSPWVGVGLDLDRCVGEGRLADWLEHLGWRLAAVHLSQAGEMVGTGESGRLGAWLDQVAFDGPIVVAGGRGPWWQAGLNLAGTERSTSG